MSFLASVLPYSLIFIFHKYKVTLNFFFYLHECCNGSIRTIIKLCSEHLHCESVSVIYT